MSARRPRLTCALLLKKADHTLAGWLAWHLALGVEHIVVIDSGAFDNGRQTIQAYQADWPVSWIAAELDDTLSAEERRLNLTRLALTSLRHITQELDQSTSHRPDEDAVEDWIAILDADEYLSPNYDLRSLFQHTKDNTTAIALHWRIYGTAGHLMPPPGHIINNYVWHAPPEFHDHHFVRLLARLDHLPEANALTNPFLFDLPLETIIRSDGQAYQPHDDSTLAAPWKGGAIQHYICAQAHDETELPAAMRAHYDRNEQITTPERDKVQLMRQLANHMRESALRAGLSRLRDLVQQQLEKQRAAWLLHDSDLTLEDHVRHETFLYDRIRPSLKDVLTLNPQFSAHYEPGRTVLLRSTEGQLLECDPPEHHRPFAGFWQESTPHLLTLYTQDATPFTLGDAPCPFGMVSLHITYDPVKQTVLLPHETGHGSTVLEMIPAAVPPPMLFTPLPPANEEDGLSVHGLLMWLAGHPTVQPQDLQRALLLLSPSSTQHLRTVAPILEEFLPRFTKKPAFLP
ncbi:hypothetical protein BG621_05435 [Parasaccharibacter apium]|nr:hypothetical protein BG621_05435 [Parasaccharibacter apium]